MTVWVTVSRTQMCREVCDILFIALYTLRKMKFIKISKERELCIVNTILFSNFR